MQYVRLLVVYQEYRMSTVFDMSNSRRERHLKEANVRGESSEASAVGSLAH